MLRPAAPKHEVLARYAVSSLEPEEHRKMMSSRDTWENRFDEAARLIPWTRVRSWLDVGCGTARFFEKVLASGQAPALTHCVGVDAVGGNIAVARGKAWPPSPALVFHELDIEALSTLDSGPFDLVTMVGVVYQCGLPPAVAVAQCVSQLASAGVLLVTSENPRFKGFVADRHGCYPLRADFEEMFRNEHRHPPAVTVQYTNPLWNQRQAGLPEEGSADFKEIFFLAEYGASA